MYYIHIISATAQSITGHARTLWGVKRNVAQSILNHEERYGKDIKSVRIYKVTKNAPKLIECIR